MTVSSTEETEDERKARLAREEQEKRNAAQLSLADAKGFLGTVSDLIGTVFNWGVPALIIGGLFLGFSKQIGGIIGRFNPEWGEKFEEYAELAKEWINEKTGREVFTPDAAVLERAKRNHVAENPTALRSAIERQLGKDIAAAIVPDQQASAEIVNQFLPSQNLTIGQLQTNPELFAQPRVLEAFVRRYPETMQRVVGALPQGSVDAAGQVPDMLRAPLKQLLGNPQSLQALLNDPRHAQWIIPAVARLGGDSAAVAFNAMRSNPPQLAGLMSDMIDGVPAAQALEHAKQHGALPDAVRQLAYEEAKKHEVYGPMIAAIEAKDPSFAAELQAVLERTTDTKQIGEHVLAMVTSNPARIAALKELTPEQLAPIMGAFSITLSDTQSIMFADTSVRDAAIDALAGFARTNTSGKNELGALLAAISAPEGDTVTRAAQLARYVQADAARAQVLQQFATTLENIGNGRGVLPAQEGRDAIDLKLLYTSNAASIHMLASAPEKAVELAKVHTALPAGLRPITLGMFEHGPTYLADVMVDDTQRAVLGQDTNGRKNLYIIGDAMNKVDLAQLGIAGTPLAALLAPAADGSYKNLDTLVAAVQAVDNASGLNHADSVALIQEMQRIEANPAGVTQEQIAALQTRWNTEAVTDRDSVHLAAFMQGIRGATLQSGEGETAIYRVETAFGPVDLTPAQIAEYFKANDTLLQQGVALAGLDDATKQAITASGAQLWNDTNKNGVIDTGEGAAAVFKNAEETAMVLAAIANPTGTENANLQNIGRGFASLFLSSDMNAMLAVADTLRGAGSVTNGQNVDGVDAPGGTNRLASQSIMHVTGIVP